MIGNRPVPGDVVLGLVSGLMGIVFIIGAVQIEPDPSAFSVLGPRVAPLAIGIAAVLCSIALVVQATRHARSPEAAVLSPGRGSLSDSPDPGLDPDLDADLDPGSRPEPTTSPGHSLPRLLGTFGLFTGYILIFIPLGYVISTFVFLFALTTYHEARKWRRNLVYAAAFAVLVYLLFTRGLQVQLPPGLLG